MIIDQYDAFIFDMDGVLWRGSEIIGNPKQIFEMLTKNKKRYAFATNNSTKHVDVYAEKLIQLGISAVPDQILTSGKATAIHLLNKFPAGGNVFVVGGDGLLDTLQGHGFVQNGHNPLAVIVGLDKNLSYEKLTQATLYIREGAYFVGTNPDTTFPIPEGLAPGAGSLLAFLNASTGVTADVIGKPSPIMFQQALEFLDSPPERTLVIGDRLETDIAGGKTAGCATALLLSGVTPESANDKYSPAPDHVAADLKSLFIS